MKNAAEQKTPIGLRSGARIRDLRIDRGWSQRELSDRTDNKLSPSRIANYEQGTRKLGVQEAEILGKALRVQPGYLMGVTKLKNPLSPLEEELVSNFRTLPENERDSYFRRIEALALAYKTPVADERLGEGWTAPSKTEVLEPEEPVKPARRARRKPAKQT